MAPVFILIGFGFGYLLGKMLKTLDLYPRNIWYKLLISIGIPSIIYGLAFLAVGNLYNWKGYLIGGAMVTYTMGCAALLVSLLIFVKVKKHDKQVKQEEQIEETLPIAEAEENSVTDTTPQTGDVIEESIGTDAVPQIEENIETPESTVLSSVNPKGFASMNIKKIIIFLCVLCVMAIGVFMAIWAIDKHNIRKAEALRQEEIRELVLKGNDAYNKGLYELAIKQYAACLKLDSLNWGLYYKFGNCYYALEEDSRAASWYCEAYKCNPNHQDDILCGDTLYYEEFLYKYAFSQRNAHPLSETSLELAQEFYSLYPDNPKAYRSLTFAYLFYANELDFDRAYKNKMENYKQQSLQWAKKMVEKFPTNSDSYFCLAYVYSDMKDYELAIANYRKSIELTPTGGAYNNLGICYYNIHEKQEAYKYWRKAVKLDGNKNARNSLKRNGQPVD